MTEDLVQRSASRSSASRRDIAEIPVVCIGISSGGLNPLKILFGQLPSTTGMAFVVLHHVRRKPSRLPDILRRCTSMPVVLATDLQLVRPNHIYVLPSGTEMTMSDAHMKVRPATKQHGWSNVITTFLLSLAKSKHPGIAIILSGCDDDGAAALQAFKRHGGTTIVQDLSSADQQDMPQSAIRTGTVDYVVSPEAMAPLLENLATRYQKAKAEHA